MAKDWKGDIKDAEDALEAVQDFIPALEKRDATNQNASPQQYADILAKDEVSRTYEAIREIVSRNWGNGNVRGL